tara:strand:+ start:804 stop:986 length:183 start_codon:yes stop_codon:yes gene_type:complete
MLNTQLKEWPETGVSEFARRIRRKDDNSVTLQNYYREITYSCRKTKNGTRRCRFTGALTD